MAKTTKPPKGKTKEKATPKTARKPKTGKEGKPRTKAAPKAKRAPAHVLATSEGVRAETRTGKHLHGLSTYTPEIADEILHRMHGGETLREICRDEHLPSESSVRRWNMDDVDGFSARYASARTALLDYWADDIVTIGDDGRNDWMERRNSEGEAAGWTVNGEHVSRSKLRCENRKWLLSKLRPDVYGDRSTVNHGLTGEFVAFLGQIDGHSAALV